MQRHGRREGERGEVPPLRLFRAPVEFPTRPPRGAAAEHPQAWFVASQLVFDADRLTEAHGEFTLRGISRPLTLRALRFACRPDGAREVCGGDFEAEFRRSDYGITFGLPFVADTVRLVIQVEATRTGG